MSPPRTKTPWGWYEVLATGQEWQVKILYVQPGHRTSLQKHAHRSEWWYLLDGGGLYTVGTQTLLPGDVSWVHIYSGREHRLTGSPPDGLTVLELQLAHSAGGLSEADILRIADDYDRK